MRAIDRVNGAIEIIDQTALPADVRVLRLTAVTDRRVIDTARGERP